MAVKTSVTSEIEALTVAAAIGNSLSPRHARAVEAGALITVAIWDEDGPSTEAVAQLLGGIVTRESMRACFARHGHPGLDVVVTPGLSWREWTQRASLPDLTPDVARALLAARPPPVPLADVVLAAEDLWRILLVEDTELAKEVGALRETCRRTVLYLTPSEYEDYDRALARELPRSALDSAIADACVAAALRAVLSVGEFEQYLSLVRQRPVDAQVERTLPQGGRFRPASL